MTGAETMDNQKVLSVDQMQQLNDKICLDNPKFTEQSFKMTLNPDKEGGPSYLPLTANSFKDLVQFDGEKRAYNFIDDTEMLISLFTTYKSQNIYVTGPRRFGKTVKLSMFKTFLDGHCGGDPVVKDENKKAFEGLNVSKDSGFCERHQQKYYTIALNFAELGSVSNMAEMEKYFINILYDVYKEFVKTPEAANDALFLGYFNFLKRASIGEPGPKLPLMSCLNILARHIRDSFRGDSGIQNGGSLKIALLVDEFDKPFNAAASISEEFHKEVTRFMNGLFTGIKGGLFSFTFLTGVDTLPLSSGSSTFNCFEVISVFDAPYHQWYGFLEADVDKLLMENGLTAYKKDFSLRYNGYHARGVTDNHDVSVYNPFSVLCAIKNKRFDKYWSTTESRIRIISRGFIDRQSRINFCAKLTNLIKSGTKVISTTTPETPPKDHSFNEKEAWEGLHREGYITIPDDLNSTIAVIPNWEILLFFHDLNNTLYGLDNLVFSDIQESLREQRLGKFVELMTQSFHRSLSHASNTTEANYNTFLNVFLQSGFTKKHDVDMIQSEKRVFGGTADMVVTLEKEGKPIVYIFELKYIQEGQIKKKVEEKLKATHVNNSVKQVGKRKMAGTRKKKIDSEEAKADPTKEVLKDLVKDALQQIQDKRYDRQYYEYETVIRVGIAFSRHRFLFGHRSTRDGPIEGFIDSDEFHSVAETNGSSS